MYYYRNRLISDLTATLKNMLALHQSFKGWMGDQGVELSDTQFDKLSKYLQLLKSKNEELNLTAIKDSREAWIKHILDSLMAAPFFKEPGMKVIDIGTGGGIPGIPLAILFPSANFTLVDSTQKKAEAVEEFAKGQQAEGRPLFRATQAILGHGGPAFSMMDSYETLAELDNRMKQRAPRAAELRAKLSGNLRTPTMHRLREVIVPFNA